MNASWFGAVIALVLFNAVNRGDRISDPIGSDRPRPRAKLARLTLSWDLSEVETACVHNPDNSSRGSSCRGESKGGRGVKHFSRRAHGHGYSTGSVFHFILPVS